MTKKFIHECIFTSSIYGKKRTTNRKGPLEPTVAKKELTTVYNKFYRDQVSALYRAIHSNR